MAMTMHVDIVSAEKEVFSGTVEFLLAPAEQGEVGILPRHSEMLCMLSPGQVMVRLVGGEEQWIYVAGGILEVQPHVVTILSDTAEQAYDLDEAKIIEAKRKAQEAMAQRSSEFDYAQAQAELLEALAQLRVLEKIRKTKGKPQG